MHIQALTLNCVPVAPSNFHTLVPTLSWSWTGWGEEEEEGAREEVVRGEEEEREEEVTPGWTGDMVSWKYPSNPSLRWLGMSWGCRCKYVREGVEKWGRNIRGNLRSTDGCYLGLVAFCCEEGGVGGVVAVAEGDCHLEEGVG